MKQQRTIHIEDRDRFAFGGPAAVRMAVQEAASTLPPPPKGREWIGTLVDTSLRVNVGARRHEAEVNFRLSEIEVPLRHPLVIDALYDRRSIAFIHAKPRGSILL